MIKSKTQKMFIVSINNQNQYLNNIINIHIDSYTSVWFILTSKTYVRSSIYLYYAIKIIKMLTSTNFVTRLQLWLVTTFSFVVSIKGCSCFTWLLKLLSWEWFSVWLQKNTEHHLLRTNWFSPAAITVAKS